MDDVVKRSRRTAGTPRRVAHNRIKALREERGLTLDALAERAGTTNQQICHLEAGRRRLTVDWLRRLGDALACHPWALVSEIAPDALSVQEANLVQAFAALGASEREACLTLINALARSHGTRPMPRRK